MLARNLHLAVIHTAASTAFQMLWMKENIAPPCIPYTPLITKKMVALSRAGFPPSSADPSLASSRQRIIFRNQEQSNSASQLPSNIINLMETAGDGQRNEALR